MSSFSLEDMYIFILIFKLHNIITWANSQFCFLKFEISYCGKPNIICHCYMGGTFYILTSTKLQISFFVNRKFKMAAKAGKSLT
jgi:hypothetical protein